MVSLPDSQSGGTGLDFRQCRTSSGLTKPAILWGHKLVPVSAGANGPAPLNQPSWNDVWRAINICNLSFSEWLWV